MSASGPYGDARTDAFGRIDGSTPALRNVGERLTDGLVSISGVWGVLTGIAAVVALAGAQLYRKTGAGLNAVIGASIANAIFVPVTLLYLNGKAPEFREMTEDHDELKDALGDILNGLFGGGKESDADTTQQVATVALTNQALICGLVAMITAVIAIGLRSRIRPAYSDAAARVEVARRAMAEELPGSCRDAAHDIDVVLEPQLELVVQYEPQLLGRGEPDQDDDRGAPEAGKQRLLPRAELPRRNDNQLGQMRRERPPTRRPRPRPANRTSATPQPATGAAASRNGRSAALSQQAPTALADR
ncbi:hypothetical protein [Nocardia sp. NBC_00416]|uniref:hypothetical protein n=1 Tax=Nocardia sp. NBC_00416 TaxID=2975991 RepID=UPI002E24D58A